MQVNPLCIHMLCCISECAAILLKTIFFYSLLSFIYKGNSTDCFAFMRVAIHAFMRVALTKVGHILLFISVHSAAHISTAHWSELLL